MFFRKTWNAKHTYAHMHNIYHEQSEVCASISKKKAKIHLRNFLENIRG